MLHIYQFTMIRRRTARKCIIVMIYLQLYAINIT